MIQKAPISPFPRGISPEIRRIRESGLGSILGVFLGSLMLHTLGKVGQGIALIGLVFVLLHLFSLAFQGQRWSFRSALLLGVLVNGEVFVRDFAMRGLPAGYLGVEYLVIALGLASLPALTGRHWSLMVSGPVILLFCICLWDVAGLFYTEDVWRGRIILGLHGAGLACLLLGAVVFAGENSRRGILDGLILGTFLSFGVMLGQTFQASRGIDLDSQFRFGHALVSAVQVGIVLTTGILACLLKLISSYGKLRNSLIPIALLAPFCIATFSRGPMLALFLGGLCLSFCMKRSPGWWKLPAAGLLLAVAVMGVMWALPSNFDSRYRDLDGKDDRLRIWRVVGEMWKESPIIGYGSGSWSVVYSRFASNADRAPRRISDAHNFILQAAADGGVIGVSLFVFFLVALLWRIARARSWTGLSLFVFVFVNASLANFKLSVLFLLLGTGLGACLAPQRSPGRALSAAGVQRRRPLPPNRYPDASRFRFLPQRRRLSTAPLRA